MNHLGTMYATKRRRRNSKSVRVPPKDGQTKSNPSKRHRERLNAELDTLANLLPYEQSVLSKLDKLSILRLSVSYLRTKSYFQAAIHRDIDQRNEHKPRELLYPDLLMEGDLILQALNGFLLILTCDGEVFYASHTVETYLGFHQSDICHQSVYELVHSEDREELQRHLLWNSHLPQDRANLSLQDALLHDQSHFLERNFTVRFRCLLDNTSGFLRLDIRGRIKVLHGQNHKTEDPPLALFAVCTPFGPPSLLEMPQKESMFKSKHKLDLSLVSIDQRGKQVLGYSDSEMTSQGGYDLVHFDDLAYVASAHQELLKTGASGLIAYRLQTKEGDWQWLQTSARLVYKNSKPDFILCTHRPLMEEEGRDLLGKRTMDFKVTYLDGGLGAITDRSSLLNDNDLILRCQRSRRYKSQVKDILHTCRKRKTSTEQYAEEQQPYNNVYAYPTTEPVNGISPYTAPMSQNLFTAAIDNSRFLAPENFLHYRHLGTYYPDYGQYPGNGFLELPSSTPRTCFTTYPDSSQLVKEEKLYPCQLDAAKFNGDTRLVQTIKPSCYDGYDQSLRLVSTGGIQPVIPSVERTDISKISDFNCRSFALQPVAVDPDCVNAIKSKNVALSPSSLRDSPQSRDEKSDSMLPHISPFTNDTRQSVLMWGNTIPSRPPSTTPTSLYDGKLAQPKYVNLTCSKGEDISPLCRWTVGNVATPKSTSPHNSTSPASGKVAPTVVTNACMPYPSELEHHMVRSELLRRHEKYDGMNPLLSISEVTNTLLNHD